VRMYACMHVYICVCVCIYIYIYINYMHRDVQYVGRKRKFVFVCVCVFTYMHTSVLVARKQKLGASFLSYHIHIHTYIYIYIQTYVMPAWSQGAAAAHTYRHGRTGFEVRRHTVKQPALVFPRRSRTSLFIPRKSRAHMSFFREDHTRTCHFPRRSRTYMSFQAKIAGVLHVILPAKITYVNVIFREDRRRTTCYPSRENHLRTCHFPRRSSQAYYMLSFPRKSRAMFACICCHRSASALFARACVFSDMCTSFSTIHLLLLVNTCVSARACMHELPSRYAQVCPCTESLVYVQNVHCMYRICTVCTECALYA
jgi:hypothetical protein